MALTPDLKLSIILIISLLGMSLVTFLVVIRSIGDISHILDRLHDIISKELVLTYNRNVSNMKQSKRREDQSMERFKRQEALLNIPLVVKKNKAQKQRDTNSEGN